MKAILKQETTNNITAKGTKQKRQPTSNEIAAAISQMNSILTATGNHAQVKDNKIVMILHADFDGIGIRHLLKSLLKVKGYREDQIIVEFADNYNFEDVISKYIGDNPQQITHLLIADIAGITKTEEIEELRKQGVNVAYLEHHENSVNKEIANKYPWAEIDTKNNKCSTIQVFLMLLKILKDKDANKRGTVEFINDYLKGSDEAMRNFLIEELQELEDPEIHKNAEYCFKFFDDLLKVSNDDIEKYDAMFKIFKDSINLSKAVNSVINAHMNQMTKVGDVANKVDNRKPGADLIMDVWDLLIYESGLENIDDALNKLQVMINGLPESEQDIKNKIIELRSKTNYENRLKESGKSIFTFRFKDAATGKYIKVKMAFSHGDTRFKTEGLRGKEEHQDADMFITFTDVPIVKNPIFTMKPTKKEGDAEKFADKTKIPGQFMKGSKTGIALQYSREAYNKLKRLNERNAELLSKQMNETERKEYQYNLNKIEEIMMQEIRKKFIDVKFERELEDKLDSKFEF